MRWSGFCYCMTFLVWHKVNVIMCVIIYPKALGVCVWWVCMYIYINTAFHFIFFLFQELKKQMEKSWKDYDAKMWVSESDFSPRTQLLITFSTRPPLGFVWKTSPPAKLEFHYIIFPFFILAFQGEDGERKEGETETVWADPVGIDRHSGGHGKRKKELPAPDVWGIWGCWRAAS